MRGWSRFCAQCMIISLLQSSGFLEHLYDSFVPLLPFISLLVTMSLEYHQSDEHQILPHDTDTETPTTSFTQPFAPLYLSRLFNGGSLHGIGADLIGIYHTLSFVVSWEALRKTRNLRSK